MCYDEHNLWEMWCDMMKQQKTVKVLTYFYLIPFALMVLFNTGNSLLRTTYFELYKDMETARYKWDNPLLVLIVSAVLLAGLYLFWRFVKWEGRRSCLLSVLAGGVISLAVVLITRGRAICDGATISEIAVEFMQGNYHAFAQGEYLYNYSFQIGMTAFLEAIYRIFGAENFLAFQIINVICIMVFLWCLNRITWELFKEEKICRLEAALSVGMLPLFLFSVFVYGDIIGWAFGVGAIYLIIRYLKTDRWQSLFGASFLLAAGIVVKSNVSILLVAAVIAVLLNALCKHRYKILVMLIPMVILPTLFTGVVETVYARRAGLPEYPEGIPKVAWMAMSLQETDEGGYACGWYNSYNWNVYRENDYDREKTTRACITNLKQSLHKMAHEQKYALNYFYKKFTSQWNAPTFQSMITAEWSVRHVEGTGPVARYFIYERGRDILYGIMNIYHFLLFLCTCVALLRMGKEWSLPGAYLILNIFGGFFFHMIWEAQSRYIIGYFVLMLPLAAFGCDRLFGMWKRGRTGFDETAG